ncbi:MAG: glycosyltransferase family 2 protein, partial [Hyphomonadaceae bacterium]
AFASFTGLARLERFAPALRGIDRRCDPMPAAPTPMPVVSGALMFMARRDFEALGGFDEGYFLHVEDIDLCRRAHEAGGAVIFTPHAGAFHVGASSKAPARLVAWRKARGFHRYFRKFARSWPERAAADLAGAALCVLLPARALLARRD